VRDSLESQLKRFEELEHLLADPAVASDPRKVRAYAKEHAALRPLVELDQQAQRVRRQIQQAREMLETGGGHGELAELARAELEELGRREEELAAQIEATVLGQDPVLFPADYPARYRHIYPTYVLLGSHRHWRSAHGTTGADIISTGILHKYWGTYMAFSQYGIDPEVTEENTIDLILREVPCYSPLPSLAVHFQHFDTLSPYFDWRKWWERSAIQAPDT